MFNVNMLRFTNYHHPFPPWVKSIGCIKMQGLKEEQEEYEDSRMEGKVWGIYIKMQGLKEEVWGI